MSKKFKDDWSRFVHTITTRKRATRPYVIPRDYIEAIADSIHTSNPSKEIIINTLVDFYSVCFEKTYKRFISDNNFRREKEEKRFEADWKRFKDEVDDRIHAKNIKV